MVLGFLFASLLGKSSSQTEKKQPPSSLPPLPPGKPCPLCQSALVRGERVHGVVYQSTKEDKLMDIFGCPYCYKEHPKGEGKHRYERTCPVCAKTLNPGEAVFARVFTRQDKTHVHVLGCLRCRK